eukprot:6184600-Pleurochrysis_carterae.AAC.1
MRGTPPRVLLCPPRLEPHSMHASPLGMEAKVDKREVLRRQRTVRAEVQQRMQHGVHGGFARRKLVHSTHIDPRPTM